MDFPILDLTIGYLGIGTWGWTGLGLALTNGQFTITPFKSLLYIYKESSGND